MSNEINFNKIINKIDEFYNITIIIKTRMINKIKSLT